MTFARKHPDLTWRAPGRPDLPGGAVNVAPVAGAAKLGTADYTVPAGALYVSTSGNDSNPGTKEAPKATLAAARDAAPVNGTIEIRGGEYREKPGDFGTKRLTIQNYPGEEVWFDGSDVVTGFTGSGPWVKTGWTVEFDSSTSYTTGDTGLRFIDPAYPEAARPDMVFIDGVRQVLVSGTPAAGQFAVDYAANTLTLGSNPTGKTVRASVRDWWGIVRASGSVIRGIGIRRYATSLAGAQATLIVTSAAVGAVIENVRMEDCGQQSISDRGRGTIVRQTSIFRAGAVGLHSTKTKEYLYDRLYVYEANYRHFKHEPIAAAVKLSPDCNNGKVIDSIFQKSYSYGLWFDTDCFDNVVTGCLAKDCETVGIYSEANDNVIFAGNYVEGNGNFGMTNLLSTRMKMWCNQADNHKHWDIGVSQDERRNTNPATMARAPWIVSQTEVCNNVFTNKTGPTGKLFQAYVLDKSTGRVASLMVSALSGNLFSAHNPDGVSSTRMFGWDMNGDNQISGAEIFKTAATFRAVTGWDNTVTALTDPTPQQVASFNSAANPLPDDVAKALNVPAGTRLMGPPKPRPVVAAT